MRQAINYAIPVAAIVPNVLMGYGSAVEARRCRRAARPDGNPRPYKFDLDKAKALMKEAGVTAGAARSRRAHRLAAA